MIHTVINVRKRTGWREKNANSEYDLRFTYETV